MIYFIFNGKFLSPSYILYNNDIILVNMYGIWVDLNHKGKSRKNIKSWL